MDVVEIPDVAGPGWVECPCGEVGMRSGPRFAAGMGLTMRCPNCGLLLESWETRGWADE